MGFVTAAFADTNWHAQGNPGLGTGVTLPNTVIKNGDLLVLAVNVSQLNPTSTWTCTGLTNAFTRLLNANMTGVFSGSTALFTCPLVYGDRGLTFTPLYSPGSGGWGYAYVIVRSDIVTAASLTVTLGTPSLFSVAAATVLCPQNTPSHPHDFRFLMINTLNNPTNQGYVIAESQTVDNPGAAQVYFCQAGFGGTSSGDIILLGSNQASVLDGAAANITVNGATSNPPWWIQPFIISEGASDAAPAVAAALDDVPLELYEGITATGVDHDVGTTGADIIGRGGGSGISVY